jgi:hypothetical protein
LSATATYGAKQLLHFSSESLAGTAGPIPVTNADAVQVAAYLGDVTDLGGPLSLQDAGGVATVAGSVANTTAQTIPGFAAWPNLDPAIIGDVSLQGNVNSTDAGAMTQEIGGLARITIPYAPIGLAVTPTGPGATVSVPNGVPATPTSTSGPQGRTFFRCPTGFGQPTQVQAPQANQQLQASPSPWSVAVVGQALGNGDQSSQVNLENAILWQDDADLVGMEAYFAQLAGKRGHSRRI